ncbi:S24 family peptidase [Roseobacter sp. S98]|uniref:S24 family peptidase n=1 Tax=Roseobacter algicola (ex Choi et al. 2025) (nom. illeg.) TaxID=3092138 RepID=UPI0035C77CE9
MTKLRKSFYPYSIYYVFLHSMNLTELYELIESRRKELGLTQVEVEKRAFGRARNGSFQNIRRGAWPSFDKLQALAKVLKLELKFGLPENELLWSSNNAPFRGQAACSMVGKFASADNAKTLPLPTWLDDERAFWVQASGKSMQAEGIRSGDYCLISPSRQVEIGDRVYLKDMNGKAVIKRLVDIHKDRVELRGWQNPRESAQNDYADAHFLKFVQELYSVVAVFRGQPGSGTVEAELVPDPRSNKLPPESGLVPVEVLHEDLIPTPPGAVPLTLGFDEQWLKSISLSPKDAALLPVVDKDMEPTFGKSAIAMIDKSETAIEDGALYAVTFGSAIVVRRLEKLEDGTLIVRADTRDSRTSVLPPERAGAVEIFGRVVWSGRSLQGDKQ